MLLSTLPDLPGRVYDVKGMVFSKVEFSAGSKGKRIQDLEMTFDMMIGQASKLGADAIVDIKITKFGIVLGTAVKLL